MEFLDDPQLTGSFVDMITEDFPIHALALPTLHVVPCVDGMEVLIGVVVKLYVVLCEDIPFDLCGKEM